MQAGATAGVPYNSNKSGLTYCVRKFVWTVTKNTSPDTSSIIAPGNFGSPLFITDCGAYRWPLTVSINNPYNFSILGVYKFTLDFYS